MADDIVQDDLTTQTSSELERQNTASEAEKRIKQLSEKVRMTSEERDEKDKLLGEREQRIAELERDKSFSDGFADVLGNHPQAKDHKDEIREKVLAGYSVEDAAFAVLGKAGKLGGSPQPTAEIAGGSASNAINQATEKSAGEMTQEERRAELEKTLSWS